MARRKRRDDSSGQVPFADLAMAALAPVAVFMLLFMLLSSSTADLCTRLTPDEVQLRIQELDKLFEQEGIVDFDFMEQAIQSFSCNERGNRIIKETEYSTQSAELFHKLNEIGFGEGTICEADLRKVLEGSKLGPQLAEGGDKIIEEYNDSIVKSLSAIEECYSNIVPNICTPLTREQIDQRVAEMNRIFDKYGKELMDDINRTLKTVECNHTGFTYTTNSEEISVARSLQLDLATSGIITETTCIEDINTILKRSSMGSNISPAQVASTASGSLERCYDMAQTHFCTRLSDEEITSRVQWIDELFDRYRRDQLESLTLHLDAPDCDLQGVVVEQQGEEQFRKLRDSLQKEIREIGLDSDELCASDVHEILTRSKFADLFSGDGLSGFMNGSLQRSLETFKDRCLKDGVIRQPPVKRVEFASCRTTPLDPESRKVLPPEYFDKEVAWVAQQLSRPEYTSYNRIDIFGHTDLREVVGQCDENGARNNRELSSLRVNAYLSLLQEALVRNRNRDPSHGVIYDRWKSGKLRFYAIGVGADEPAKECAPPIGSNGRYLPCASDEAHRRIEMRYVRDTRKQ